MDSNNPTREEQNLDELAAIFGNRQLTDDNGVVIEGGEEPSTESTAAQEMKTSEEEAPTAEKPTESEPTPSQEEASDEETLGVDDSGKRYVPEKRFKEVYGKAKQTERELEAIKAQLEQGNRLLESTKTPGKALAQPERVIDKADILELKLTKPQFNPQNQDYNPALDQLAYKIFKADPSISIMEAANQAEQYAKEIAMQVAGARAEARQVKTIQADQGIAGRAGQRQESSPDFDSMSPEQMEAWLKANNQW